MREITEAEKEIYIETAKILKGTDRRVFMARVVNALGYGGQYYVEKEFHWNHETIKKGQHELKTGERIVDNFSARGAKRVEDRLANLSNDIRNIVDGETQTDPTFKTTELFTRMTSREVRNQLIIQKGYSDEELPTEETIRKRLNELGYSLKKVTKVKPKKKIPETDKIFENLKDVHEKSKNNETVLRISLDAKDKVRMGELSRGGSNRTETKALDHDFYKDTITPFGLFLPDFNETYLYMNETFTSSDFIVDCLEDFWKTNKEKFPKVTKLLLNFDNGGENSSRRTQFMKRIVDFVENENIEIELAYYPPYHSKYNPIERVWGVLEKHWNGTLLNSVTKVLGFAKSMTYNGISPVVKLVDKIYKTGVKLTKSEMEEIEKKIIRVEGLEKWAVKVPCLA